MAIRKKTQHSTEKCKVQERKANRESHVASCFLPGRFVKAKNGRDVVWLVHRASRRWALLRPFFARKGWSLPRLGRSLLGTQAPR